MRLFFYALPFVLTIVATGDATASDALGAKPAGLDAVDSAQDLDNRSRKYQGPRGGSR